MLQIAGGILLAIIILGLTPILLPLGAIILIILIGVLLFCYVITASPLIAPLLFLTASGTALFCMAKKFAINFETHPGETTIGLLMTAPVWGSLLGFFLWITFNLIKPILIAIVPTSSHLI